jgi:tetratricopeptide (TPR) repeat protein
LPTFALSVAEGLLTEAAASVAGKSDLLGWDETEKRFVQGKLTLLSHRYSEAAKIFAQVPLTAPEGAAAWNLRVLAHALAGEWEDAFAACGEDALWRWLLHRWQGSEPENLSVPTEWLTSLRENFRELLALLLQLREFERYEQALSLLERLVPDERERAELLGDLYGQFGFWEMALEMLLPFAQDGGLTRDGWRTLAKACQHKGYYDEAIAIWLRLVESDEEKGEALADYLSLAGCYIAAGKSQQAQQVLALVNQLR